jgi:hypothetical protein
MNKKGREIGVIGYYIIINNQTFFFVVISILPRFDVKQ